MLAALRNAVERLVGPTKNELRLRAAIDGRLDTFLIVAREEDGDFTFLLTNRHAARDLGLDAAPAIGSSVRTALARHPKRAELLSLLDITFRSRASREGELSGPGDRWYHYQLVPIDDGVAVSLRDITTEHEDAKARLELATLLESSQDAIVVYDKDKRVLGWSRSAERLFGYSRAEVIGKTPPIVPLDRLHELENISRGIRRVDDMETVRVTKDGRVIDVTVSASTILDEDGTPVGFLSLTRELGETSHEREMAKSLEHTRVLLQEVHHRVKNNLQIVASLINLQAEHITDPEIRALFRETQDRVRSIAMFHEKLYPSRDQARVDLRDYLQDLAQMLTSTRRPFLTDVSVEVTALPVLLPLDTAIPCGLVANELVTNALKHAFQAHQRGRIDIALAQAPDGEVTMVVADDGAGLPASVDLTAPRSLGLQIVTTLVEQIEGRISVERSSPGTRYTIAFRPSK